MKHETFKSIYPFLENALASFIEVLRHWVMWWKPPAICHGFSNFIFSSVPRKGVSLVYSWVHQATPVFKLQTANCSPARVKIHCRPLLRTWGRRGARKGENTQWEISEFQSIPWNLPESKWPCCCKGNRSWRETLMKWGKRVVSLATKLGGTKTCLIVRRWWDTHLQRWCNTYRNLKYTSWKLLSWLHSEHIATFLNHKRLEKPEKPFQAFHGVFLGDIAPSTDTLLACNQPLFLQKLTARSQNGNLGWIYLPLRMPVATRTISFLRSGISNLNLHLPRLHPGLGGRSIIFVVLGSR